MATTGVPVLAACLNVRSIAVNSLFQLMSRRHVSEASTRASLAPITRWSRSNTNKMAPQREAITFRTNNHSLTFSSGNIMGGRHTTTVDSQKETRTSGCSVLNRVVWSPWDLQLTGLTTLHQHLAVTKNVGAARVQSRRKMTPTECRGRVCRRCSTA